MTETKEVVEAPPKPALNPVFEPLPDNIKAQIATLPPELNDRERRGQHLSPLMGRLSRATRASLSGISQKALAEQVYAKPADGGLMTTHCQIATLEQGGCKRGASIQTIKLLAHAVSVDPAVIEAINKADLQVRADRGDEVAKKALGIVEPEPTPEPTPTPTPEPTGTDVVKAEETTAKPTPPPAKKAAATTPAPPPAKKTATAPAAKPAKETVPM
jgi:hypothetical protein